MIWKQRDPREPDTTEKSVANLPQTIIVALPHTLPCRCQKEALSNVPKQSILFLEQPMSIHKVQRKEEGIEALLMQLLQEIKENRGLIAAAIHCFGKLLFSVMDCHVAAVILSQFAEQHCYFEAIHYLAKEK